TSSQPIPSHSPAFPTRLSSPHDSFPIPSPSPLLSTCAPLPSPLSAPDILPVILSPLDPIPTCLQPLPPDLPPMLSLPPLPVHAATSSSPLPPSLLLMSLSQPRLQPLNSLRSAPCTVKLQPPPPAPSLSSAFPPLLFDCTPMPLQSCSFHFPPPPTLHASTLPLLLPLLRPPDPAPVTSAKPQPPPPPPTVQSSQHMCSNLKTNMDHTPSTGATANAFKNATTNTDTPSLHLILEASPTVATGRTSRENATLTLCSTHHAAAAAEPKSKENS
ncbi:hypothetical protein V8E53_005536, partial [Lactarius tabidus]